MQRLGIRQLGALLSVVLVFGLLVAGIGVARAQQDDPTVDGPGTPRPGHIHTGTCAGGGLGDVVYALNNATIDNLAQDYNSSGNVDFAGSQNESPVYVSETTVDGVTLDDLLADDYAINFHLSGDQIDTYIACGEIGGFARDGVLYVGLVPVAEFPNSQFAGSAILMDNGDNSVSVVVQLVELPAASGSTAPVGATPVVTVPNGSVAPSAAGSAAGSAAPSAAGSAAASVSSSAGASASSSPVASGSSSAAASADESAAASADESAAASAAESAAASAAESAAASADESAAASAAESAAASADESAAPIESTEPEASASA